MLKLKKKFLLAKPYNVYDLYFARNNLYVFRLKDSSNEHKMWLMLWNYLIEILSDQTHVHHYTVWLLVIDNGAVSKDHIFI